MLSVLNATLAASALMAASSMYDKLPLATLGPNKAGVSVVITPVGASIMKLVVPAADGAPPPLQQRCCRFCERAPLVFRDPTPHHPPTPCMSRRTR